MAKYTEQLFISANWSSFIFDLYKKYERYNIEIWCVKFLGRGIGDV